MTLYRKAHSLRLKRFSAPEPPWFAATAIAPYGGRRGSPISIDYLDGNASGGERVDVTVTENPRDVLERLSSRVDGPAIVDCAEGAEPVFHRGEETLSLLREWDVASIALVSSLGDAVPSASLTVVSAWPVDLERIETLARRLAPERWGMIVPIIFPSTTAFDVLTSVRDIASRHGARFFAGLPMVVDATAKQAIARTLTMPDDEETYGRLFHADLEPLSIATERHVAALAFEKGLADFVEPPHWDERSNWNAATLLTLTATRMLDMESEIELAGTIARSARLVASLPKPLARIAEAANISIVEGIDEASADILSDWLAGEESAFCRQVNEKWRLRRDVGIASA